MKTHGFLDQLLKTAQQSVGGLIGDGGASGQGGKKPLLNADFGKGALTGGALGLLLGNKKARKMGGKLAVYGGVAAVGMLAYKAYGDWKKQQDGATGTTTALPVAEPRTVNALPAPEAEEHSRGILRALVAASKADGHIDARERETIEGEFVRIGAEPAMRDWLHAELEKPLDPAEVARAATSPELAAEMYLASLLAVDEQSFMERAYLDELARQLGIEDSLKARLEAQVREAVAAQG